MSFRWYNPLTRRFSGYADTLPSDYVEVDFETSMAAGLVQNSTGKVAHFWICKIQTFIPSMRCALDDLGQLVFCAAML
ncbi:hypothetical protein BKM14_10090 [Pseudomonas syringae pv. syringae]|nr:hypothetical protein BKM14_10090 [Pseudomonas syringae pv. syringae]